MTDDGTIVDRYMGMHDTHPENITLEDGRVAVRCFAAERKALQTETNPGWPMEPCVSSGVQPWQAQELRDYLKKKGVPTEVTSQGDPIYRSKAHRDAALKARNIHDRASFN